MNNYCKGFGLDIFDIFDSQFNINGFKKIIDDAANTSENILSSAKKSIMIASSEVCNLDENVKYVVDMDDDILDALEKGDLKFVTGKDGNVYAQLRDINGRFGSKLPIKKENEKQGISKDEFQMAIQIKAIEEELRTVIDTLAEIEEKVSDVIQGQHDDRKGLFYSGLSLYLESKQIKDVNLRCNMISQSLKSINDANYQMIQEIRRNVEYLITGEYKKSKNRIKNVDEKINNIYKCYEVVFNASFVKAAIYQDSGEIMAMLTSINEYGRFVEKVIVPYAGILSELDKNSKLIDSGAWGAMASTLEGCNELKYKLTHDSMYQICEESVCNG